MDLGMVFIEMVKRNMKVNIKAGSKLENGHITITKVRKIWRKSILCVLRNVHCLIRRIDEVKNMYVLILGKLLIQKNSNSLSILTNN